MIHAKALCCLAYTGLAVILGADAAVRTDKVAAALLSVGATARPDVSTTALPGVSTAALSYADTDTTAPVQFNLASLPEVKLASLGGTAVAALGDANTADRGDTNLAALPDTNIKLDLREPIIECRDYGCIDGYLWSLYERTPKLDTVKVYEKRKVTVKRKGKTRTVIKTFTRYENQDFTWKDPKAAERVAMPLMDYVIGGMDRRFKLTLYHALRAADDAGLQPGITSAFRDDYRQGIASGLKASSDRSFHGGSTRGGYGHGLAVDVVSVKGATRAERSVSSEVLWKWIDANGWDFGVGRPYLDRDPPHVAPIDGKEYVSRRGFAKPQKVAAKEQKAGPSNEQKIVSKDKKPDAVAAKKPDVVAAKKPHRAAAKKHHAPRAAKKPTPPRIALAKKPTAPQAAQSHKTLLQVLGLKARRIDGRSARLAKAKHS